MSASVTWSRSCAVPPHGVADIVQGDSVLRVIDVDANMKGPDGQILDHDSADFDIQKIVRVGRRGADHFRSGSGHQNRVGIDIGGGRGAGYLVRIMEQKIGDSCTDSLQGEKGAVGVGDQYSGCDGGQPHIDCMLEGALDRAAQDDTRRNMNKSRCPFLARTARNGAFSLPRAGYPI